MTTTTSRAYRIAARGDLSERFAAGFADVAVEREGDSTVLTGEFPDPSALHGLLSLLHDLRIELVSVDARR